MALNLLLVYCSFTVLFIGPAVFSPDAFLLIAEFLSCSPCKIC